MEVLRNVGSRSQGDWKDEASGERRPPEDGRLVERALCDVDCLVPEWEEEFLRGSVHCVWLNSVWGRTTPPYVQTPLSEDRVPKKRPVAVLKVVLKKRYKRTSSLLGGPQPVSGACVGGCAGQRRDPSPTRWENPRTTVQTGPEDHPKSRGEQLEAERQELAMKNTISDGKREVGVQKLAGQRSAAGAGKEGKT